MKSQHVQAACSGVFLAAALGLTSIATAATAELVSVSGTAMVSDGSRYVEGQQGRQLAEGDRIFGLENSNVVLQFQDGCRHTLKGNEVLTVGGQSPCSSSAAAPAHSLPAASADDGSTNQDMYALGFIGAAAIAAIALDTGGDNDPRRPISP